MSSPGRDGGFSLLEVLVAFSILALSLGALYALYSTGLRNVTLSNEYSRAITMAESKLAQIGVSEPLERGERYGKFNDRYRWSTEINEYAPDERPLENEESLQPYLVSVKVTWEGVGRDRSVVLTTLRLKSKNSVSAEGI